jgi:hypothetical protein
MADDRPKRRRGGRLGGQGRAREGPRGGRARRQDRVVRISLQTADGPDLGIGTGASPPEGWRDVSLGVARWLPV